MHITLDTEHIDEIYNACINCHISNGKVFLAGLSHSYIALLKKHDVPAIELLELLNRLNQDQLHQGLNPLLFFLKNVYRTHRELEHASVIKNYASFLEWGLSAQYIELTGTELKPFAQSIGFPTFRAELSTKELIDLYIYCAKNNLIAELTERLQERGLSKTTTVLEKSTQATKALTTTLTTSWDSRTSQVLRLFIVLITSVLLYHSSYIEHLDLKSMDVGQIHKYDSQQALSDNSYKKQSKKPKVIIVNIERYLKESYTRTHNQKNDVCQKIAELFFRIAAAEPLVIGANLFMGREYQGSFNTCTPQSSRGKMYSFLRQYRRKTVIPMKLQLPASPTYFITTNHITTNPKSPYTHNRYAKLMQPVPLVQNLAGLSFGISNHFMMGGVVRHAYTSLEFPQKGTTFTRKETLGAVILKVAQMQADNTFLWEKQARTKWIIKWHAQGIMLKLEPKNLSVPKVAKALLRNAIVLVGNTNPHPEQLFQTPVGLLPSISIHAHKIRTYISKPVSGTPLIVFVLTLTLLFYLSFYIRAKTLFSWHIVWLLLSISYWILCLLIYISMDKIMPFSGGVAMMLSGFLLGSYIEKQRALYFFDHNQ